MAVCVVLSIWGGGGEGGLVGFVLLELGSVT